VRSIDRRGGNTAIPFDHIVLSATGKKRSALIDDLKVGDAIGISIQLEHFESDCRTPLDIDWTKTYAAIGGSFHFLQDGKVAHFSNAGATARHPRTAVAFGDTYVYFIVVDGRQPGVSMGMSMAELGAFVLDRLDAEEGIALDGGGSSTMVVDGRVVNTPSDLVGASCSAEGAFWSASDGACYVHVERAVANGLMIVMDRPAQRSGAFSSGQTVLTNGEVNLRLGPGTNYAKLSAIGDGQPVLVLPHAGGLSGIWASGEYWWKVRAGDLEGWVAERWLNP